MEIPKQQFFKEQETKSPIILQINSKLCSLPKCLIIELYHVISYLAFLLMMYKLHSNLLSKYHFMEFYQRVIKMFSKSHKCYDINPIMHSRQFLILHYHT